MKISKISINRPITPIFKAKIIQMPKKQERENLLKTSLRNFQVQNNILAGNAKTVVAFSDGTSEILTIKQDDVKKYLCDSKGFVIPERIRKFAGWYQNIAQDMKEQNKQERENILQSFECFENVETIGKDDRTGGEVALDMILSDEQNEDDFVSSIICNLPYEQREILKSALMQPLEIEQENIPSIAYLKTLRLFQMSKIKGGYDFSLVESKLELIDAIEELSYQYGNNYSKEDLYNEIKETGSKQDGTLDFNLIAHAFDLIYANGFIYSPKYIIDLIKKYVSKSPQNKDEIINTMKKLNKSDFIIDPDKSDYEELMDLCFDDSGFSKNRAERLIELTNYSKEWILFQQTQKPYAGIERSISRYYNYSAFCKNIIIDYFEDGLDVSLEEYFEQKSKGLNFL